MAVDHPKFVRQNVSQKKRVGDNWRKPRGIDNKLRVGMKWAGSLVNKGYRGSVKSRYKHPQGKKEFYIRNLSELEKYGKDLQNFVLRLQAGLSKRNKELIRKKASEMKLKVLN